MKTMSAKDAEARFDQFIDTAQQEPVIVTKEDHPVGVFLSIDPIKGYHLGRKSQSSSR